MMQLGVQVLPVVQDGKVVGVINTCDLVQKHSAQAVYLIDAIQRQDSIDRLVQLMPQRQRIFEALVENETRPDHVGKVMTLIVDALTVRLIQLAEISLAESGAGEPPCAYAWMAAGSQARYELQLMSDQDNALVLSRSATANDQAYFQQLANFVCQGLADCGYELCPGDVMASNPQWCQPVQVWQQYYTQWITTPELEALLNVSIFLDTRCIFGEETLLQELQIHVGKLVKGNRRFIAALTTNTTKISPPIGFFRTFVLTRGGDNKKTFNIKKRAVSLIVDVARIYGLLAGCPFSNTEQRLQYAVDQGVVRQASYDNLNGAYRFVCQVRQNHQLQALKAGKALDNHLQPKSLSHFERNHLKDAFQVIASTQDVVSMSHSMQDK
jgi:CBS domain-containing protein